MSVHAEMPESGGRGAASDASVAAARRRLRRQLGLTGAAIAVAAFGLLRYDYPEVVAPDGTRYTLAGEGRAASPAGPAHRVAFLTEAAGPTDVVREATALLPYAADRADAAHDTLLDLVATRRRFRFGLFVVDQNTHLLFAKRKGEWVRL